MYPIISVVVPVYNVEDVLSETLDSIVKQTFKDFEVILIDDCSADQSGEICKQYVDRDHRFKYLRNESNSGPAYTRNVGIKQATGNYLAFIDSDDIVEPNYLERLHEAATENNADIVWCNIKYRHSNPNLDHIKDHGKRGLLSYEEYLGCYIHNTIGAASMCNKLYRRRFIIKNHLLINENIINSEDYDFNTRTSIFRPNVYAILDAPYNYMRRSTDSVSKTYNSCDFDNLCQSYQMLYKIAIDHNNANWRIVLNNRFLNGSIGMISKVLHSDILGEIKDQEVKRIYSSDLFRSLLANSVLKNNYLTFRTRLTALAFRYKFSRLAIIFIKIPQLRKPKHK